MQVRRLHQPVLMDWAGGPGLPVPATDAARQRGHRGAEVPDHPTTRPEWDTDTWEDGRNGGLLGITDLLLHRRVMATYLSHDWGRDWGSLRRFDTIVDADVAHG